jgi:hypothetical protein
MVMQGGRATGKDLSQGFVGASCWVYYNGRIIQGS